jgi:hypothetical protein
VRRVLTVSLAAAGLVLAGCSAPPDPEVTFYSSGTAIDVGPTQLCDVALNECEAFPEAAGVLRVPPGRPLQISVPGEVAETPWTVVFSYRNAAGEPQEPARSRIFKQDEQYAYTLTLPDPGDQLESVEVQQLGAALTPDGTDLQFFTRATWVLSIDDRG